MEGRHEGQSDISQDLGTSDAENKSSSSPKKPIQLGVVQSSSGIRSSMGNLLKKSRWDQAPQTGGDEEQTVQDKSTSVKSLIQKYEDITVSNPSDKEDSSKSVTSSTPSRVKLIRTNFMRSEKTVLQSSFPIGESSVSTTGAHDLKKDTTFKNPNSSHEVIKSVEKPVVSKVVPVAASKALQIISSYDSSDESSQESDTPLPSKDNTPSDSAYASLEKLSEDTNSNKNSFNLIFSQDHKEPGSETRMEIDTNEEGTDVGNIQNIISVKNELSNPSGETLDSNLILNENIDRKEEEQSNTSEPGNTIFTDNICESKNQSSFPSDAQEIDPTYLEVGSKKLMEKSNPITPTSLKNEDIEDKLVLKNTNEGQSKLDQSSDPTQIITECLMQTKIDESTGIGEGEVQKIEEHRSEVQEDEISKESELVCDESRLHGVETENSIKITTMGVSKTITDDIIKVQELVTACKINEPSEEKPAGETHVDKPLDPEVPTDCTTPETKEDVETILENVCETQGGETVEGTELECVAHQSVTDIIKTNAESQSDIQQNKSNEPVKDCVTFRLTAGDVSKTITECEETIDVTEHISGHVTHESDKDSIETTADQIEAQVGETSKFTTLNKIVNDQNESKENKYIEVRESDTGCLTQGLNEQAIKTNTENIDDVPENENVEVTEELVSCDNLISASTVNLSNIQEDDIGQGEQCTIKPTSDLSSDDYVEAFTENQSDTENGKIIEVKESITKSVSHELVDEDIIETTKDHLSKSKEGKMAKVKESHEDLSEAKDYENIDSKDYLGESKENDTIIELTDNLSERKEEAIEVEKSVIESAAHEADKDVETPITEHPHKTTIDKTFEVASPVSEIEAYELIEEQIIKTVTDNVKESKGNEAVDVESSASRLDNNVIKTTIEQLNEAEEDKTIAATKSESEFEIQESCNNDINIISKYQKETPVVNIIGVTEPNTEFETDDILEVSSTQEDNKTNKVAKSNIEPISYESDGVTSTTNTANYTDQSECFEVIETATECETYGTGIVGELEHLNKNKGITIDVESDSELEIHELCKNDINTKLENQNDTPEDSIIDDIRPVTEIETQEHLSENKVTVEEVSETQEDDTITVAKSNTELTSIESDVKSTSEIVTECLTYGLGIEGENSSLSEQLEKIKPAETFEVAKPVTESVTEEIEATDSIQEDSTLTSIDKDVESIRELSEAISSETIKISSSENKLHQSPEIFNLNPESVFHDSEGLKITLSEIKLKESEILETAKNVPIAECDTFNSKDQDFEILTDNISKLQEIETAKHTESKFECKDVIKMSQEHQSQVQEDEVEHAIPLVECSQFKSEGEDNEIARGLPLETRTLKNMESDVTECARPKLEQKNVWKTDTEIQGDVLVKNTDKNQKEESDRSMEKGTNHPIIKEDNQFSGDKRVLYDDGVDATMEKIFSDDLSSLDYMEETNKAMIDSDKGSQDSTSAELMSSDGESVKQTEQLESNDSLLEVLESGISKGPDDVNETYIDNQSEKEKEDTSHITIVEDVTGVDLAPPMNLEDVQCEEENALHSKIVEDKNTTEVKLDDPSMNLENVQSEVKKEDLSRTTTKDDLGFKLDDIAKSSEGVQSQKEKEDTLHSTIGEEKLSMEVDLSDKLEGSATIYEDVQLEEGKQDTLVEQKHTTEVDLRAKLDDYTSLEGAQSDREKEDTSNNTIVEENHAADVDLGAKLDGSTMSFKDVQSEQKNILHSAIVEENDTTEDDLDAKLDGSATSLEEVPSEREKESKLHSTIVEDIHTTEVDLGAKTDSVVSLEGVRLQNKDMSDLDVISSGSSVVLHDIKDKSELSILTETMDSSQGDIALDNTSNYLTNQNNKDDCVALSQNQSNDEETNPISKDASKSVDIANDSALGVFENKDGNILSDNDESNNKEIDMISDTIIDDEKVSEVLIDIKQNESVSSEEYEQPREDLIQMSNPSTEQECTMTAHTSETGIKQDSEVLTEQSKLAEKMSINDNLNQSENAVPTENLETMTYKTSNINQEDEFKSTSESDMVVHFDEAPTLNLNTAFLENELHKNVSQIQEYKVTDDSAKSEQVLEQDLDKSVNAGKEVLISTSKEDLIVMKDEHADNRNVELLLNTKEKSSGSETEQNIVEKEDSSPLNDVVREDSSNVLVLDSASDIVDKEKANLVEESTTNTLNKINNEQVEADNVCAKDILIKETFSQEKHTGSTTKLDESNKNETEKQISDITSTSKINKEKQSVVLTETVDEVELESSLDIIQTNQESQSLSNALEEPKHQKESQLSETTDLEITGTESEIALVQTPNIVDDADTETIKAIDSFLEDTSTLNECRVSTVKSLIENEDQNIKLISSSSSHDYDVVQDADTARCADSENKQVILTEQNTSSQKSSNVETLISETSTVNEVLNTNVESVIEEQKDSATDVTESEADKKLTPRSEIELLVKTKIETVQSEGNVINTDENHELGSSQQLEHVKHEASQKSESTGKVILGKKVNLSDSSSDKSISSSKDMCSKSSGSVLKNKSEVLLPSSEVSSIKHGKKVVDAEKQNQKSITSIEKKGILTSSHSDQETLKPADVSSVTTDANLLKYTPCAEKNIPNVVMDTSEEIAKSGSTISSQTLENNPIPTTIPIVNRECIKGNKRPISESEDCSEGSKSFKKDKKVKTSLSKPSEQKIIKEDTKSKEPKLDVTSTSLKKSTEKTDTSTTKVTEPTVKASPKTAPPKEVPPPVRVSARQKQRQAAAAAALAAKQKANDEQKQESTTKKVSGPDKTSDKRGKKSLSPTKELQVNTSSVKLSDTGKQSPISNQKSPRVTDPMTSSQASPNKQFKEIGRDKLEPITLKLSKEDNPVIIRSSSLSPKKVLSPVSPKTLGYTLKIGKDTTTIIPKDLNLSPKPRDASPNSSGKKSDIAGKLSYMIKDPSLTITPIPSEETQEQKLNKITLKLSKAGGHPEIKQEKHETWKAFKKLNEIDIVPVEAKPQPDTLKKTELSEDGSQEKKRKLAEEAAGPSSSSTSKLQGLLTQAPLNQSDDSDDVQFVGFAPSSEKNQSPPELPYDIGLVKQEGDSQMVPKRRGRPRKMFFPGEMAHSLPAGLTAKDILAASLQHQTLQQIHQVHQPMQARPIPSEEQECSVTMFPVPLFDLSDDTFMDPAPPTIFPDQVQPELIMRSARGRPIGRSRRPRGSGLLRGSERAGPRGRPRGSRGLKRMLAEMEALSYPDMEQPITLDNIDSEIGPREHCGSQITESTLALLKKSIEVKKESLEKRARKSDGSEDENKDLDAKVKEMKEKIEAAYQLELRCYPGKVDNKTPEKKVKESVKKSPPELIPINLIGEKHSPPEKKSESTKEDNMQPSNKKHEEQPSTFSGVVERESLKRKSTDEPPESSQAKVFVESGEDTNLTATSETMNTDSEVPASEPAAPESQDDVTSDPVPPPKPVKSRPKSKAEIKRIKREKDRLRREAKKLAALEALKAPPPNPCEEDTRMSASDPNGDIDDPLGSGIKKNRMEVGDEGIKEFTVDQIAEYQWPLQGGELYMIQEQISTYLGVKSFKRKYPEIKRRPVEMEERTFLCDSGLVSESMCDLGLTAVSSSEVLDIMFQDFQDQYEELRKHMREKQARELINKQKEKKKFEQSLSKSDLKEQAIQSSMSWNQSLNKTRNEARKCHLDLQTWTIQYPRSRALKMTKPVSKLGNYPVALIPGQYADYYKRYTAQELRYWPVNTVLYGPLQPNERHSTGGSEGSQSESEDSSSSDDSSDSSSEGEGECKVCGGGKRSGDASVQCSQCSHNSKCSQAPRISLFPISAPPGTTASVWA